MGRIFRIAPLLLLTVVVGLSALPASGIPRGKGKPQAPAILSRLSQAVQARYYLSHPDQAPAQLAGRFRAAQRATEAAASAGTVSVAPQRGVIRDLFNDDDAGLPQNEESVTVCRNKPNIVLGGTNDFRGLLDPEGNFTGWHFSTNGGKSITKEGLLPSIEFNGERIPSGGDPVSQSSDDCELYAASLNYGLDPFEEGVNGIGLYKTTPQTLRTCTVGQEPEGLSSDECWPTRRLVATAEVVGGVGQFLDKEWMDVGESGAAGEVVWVAYADFAQDVNAPLGFTGAQIKAVRCDADLADCTDPILISGADEDIQFADVTISESGRVLITWAQIEGELEETAQTFTIKARIAPAGSTEFGPTHIVNRETNPIPFGGFLHANDFRVATYPKSIMPTVGGKERPFVVWDRCRYRVLDTVCEEPEIRMSWGSENGTNWTQPRVLSVGGDNYFPAISDEIGSPRFVVAWHTHRFDRLFHNRYDVEMVTVNASTGRLEKRQRVTKISNESEADPILGGFFIGDYFDVHLLKGTAYVHYNANYRHLRLLGEGIPIPQQDNYLTKVRT